MAYLHVLVYLRGLRLGGMRWPPIHAGHFDLHVPFALRGVDGQVPERDRGVFDQHFGWAKRTYLKISGLKRRDS